MRVPISWLKTFVDIDLPVEALAERLNLAGIEVEQIEGTGADQVLVLSILANTARAQSIVGVAREVSFFAFAVANRPPVGAPRRPPHAAELGGARGASHVRPDSTNQRWRRTRFGALSEAHHRVPNALRYKPFRGSARTTTCTLAMLPGPIAASARSRI